MTRMLPEILIILGPPGSGKGTQAKALARRFGYKIIASGDLIRNFAKGNTLVQKKVASQMALGQLMPSWLVMTLWFQKLLSLNKKAKVIFDGSPRKLPEAVFIDQVLEWLGRKKAQAILIQVSEKEATSRLLLRGRKDDTQAVIKRRFKLWRKETLPVVRYFAQTKRLITINGEQPPEAVFRDILHILDN